MADTTTTLVPSLQSSRLVLRRERVGFVLSIREPRWHEHRCLFAASPPANLHVWSPDSPEAQKRYDTACSATGYATIPTTASTTPMRSERHLPRKCGR